MLSAASTGCWLPYWAMMAYMRARRSASLPCPVRGWSYWISSAPSNGAASERPDRLFHVVARGRSGPYFCCYLCIQQRRPATRCCIGNRGTGHGGDSADGSRDLMAELLHFGQFSRRRDHLTARNDHAQLSGSPTFSQRPTRKLQTAQRQ